MVNIACFITFVTMLKVLHTLAECHTLGLLHLNCEKSSYRQFQRAIQAHCLTFMTSFYTFR